MEIVFWVLVPFTLICGINWLVSESDPPAFVKYFFLPLISVIILLVLNDSVGKVIISSKGTWTLNTGTYRYNNERYVSQSGEIILLLNKKDWLIRYPYKVDCKEIESGCPDSWPKDFQVVSNGKKLVVVPLHTNEK